MDVYASLVSFIYIYIYIYIYTWYIDLARAKSEGLDNIYSLLKQNIKSCNAERQRQRER